MDKNRGKKKDKCTDKDEPLGKDKCMDLKWFFAIALAVVLLDRASKIIIEKMIPDGSSLHVFWIFSLTNVKNTGAGFSIMQGWTIVLILISIIAASAIIYYLKIMPAKYHPAAALLLGGILGNLIDRIYYGHVLDFLDFRVWPVFNFADSAITIGTLVIIFLVYLDERNEKKDKNQNKARKAPKSRKKD
jgi:signal peptidase II